MGMKSLKKVLMAKIETVYGTDAIPAGATDAVLASNVKVTPMTQTLTDRKMAQPFLGGQGKYVGERYAQLDFDVEAAGSGTAGAAPGWGVLMKGCAMSETVNAGISVVYAPISAGEQSITLYLNIDGYLYKLLGARGNVSCKLSQKSMPMMSYKFMGLFVPATDVALPVPTLGGYKQPVMVDDANTVAALQGFSGVFSDISMDLGNTVVHRNLINGEAIAFTDRKSTGSVTLEQPAIAAKDFLSICDAGTTGALSVTHGKIAGNIVKFDAPIVQLHTPQNSSLDNIEMLQMAMELIPSAGNDELTITVQ